MATESPIRMVEARGKWASRKGDEEVGHKYHSRTAFVPNRSGSAPPNMEGSFAAIGNLMQLGPHFSPDMNYSSAIGLIPQIHESGNQLRFAYFRGSSDNLFHLSRSFLPTHKEESEDDRSPQKSSDYKDQAKVASDLSKDELTCMSSPTNDKPSPSQELTTTSLSNDTDDTARDLENQTQNTGDVNVANLQSRFKDLKVSCLPNVEHNVGQGERQNIQGTLLPHHQSGNFQIHGSVPIVTSQGTNNSYVATSQYFHGGRFPPPEVQPGFTPPLYATAAASYMQSTNPYYFNAQPPGVLYPSQYGLGGYPYNANILPSFYTPQNTVPLGYDGVSGGLDGSQGFEVQQMSEPGFAPSYGYPRLQFHQNFGDVYNVPGQIDPLAQVRPEFVPGVNERRPQQRRGAISEYSGNMGSMGYYMPVPNSPLASPIMPGSPLGGNNYFGGRSDVNVTSPSAGRSPGYYPGWQGQRGFENVNHQKPYSFLEELKSGKGRRFELSDITGHVVEFSVDQHGSRFIQQKLENCSAQEKAYVFQEVVPHACKLMTDVFGNYVIQKFFEYGTPDQRRDLAKALAGHILPLSLQMYGCRVIQKALDVIELEQKIELVRELDGHVMRCVRDQNGNHVIQKCIECVPSERIGFIISAFRSHIASLSMHPYGCRVIQRVLEHCTDELQSQFIVDEILESVCTLSQDQYGNYVTQHVLERGKPQERTQIIKNLCGQVVKMSQHKFASNVVEKCLEYGDAPSRELIINEVVGHDDGSDNLLVMMKDQYANYVVQKILEKCAESQRELLIDRVKVHLTALKKYTYGKHIVARFEQLFGEIAASTSS